MAFKIGIPNATDATFLVYLFELLVPAPGFLNLGMNRPGWHPVKQLLELFSRVSFCPTLYEVPNMDTFESRRIFQTHRIGYGKALCYSEKTPLFGTMVIALLLSDPNKPLRYTDLGRVVLQCLYGAHSMCKALSILQSAIPGRELEPPCTTFSTLPSRLLSAFDAHVGDCSCQTRAQMLWELVHFYDISEKKAAVNAAITMLQELRTQAALLLQDIQQSHGKPRIPALDGLKTHLSVWQRIGFTRFLDLFNGSSDSSPGINVPETTALTNPTDSSHKRYQIITEPEWDIDNLFLVARFLTLCFLLSECKIATIKCGPPNRVIVRVDLQLMYADIGREIEASGLLPAQRNVKACDGKLNAQCQAMQGYVAIATTDWVRKAVLRLGLPDFQQSLSEGLIVANSRRISCVATYASTLLVRASWFTLNTPLLVVIQRFCSHGEFHTIYYRITRNPTCSAPSLCEMGEANWFDVTLVSNEDIIASPWATQPHVIMICMSGEGTIDDFRHLLHVSNQGGLRPSQPHNGRCREIDDYISKLKELNFARFMAHCAAHHDQFPFPLPDDVDAFERVSDLIQKGLGKRASDTFKGARDGADDFGTGRSMKMFTIEHLVVEFPVMILKELYGKPTVYGCKFEY